MLGLGVGLSLQGWDRVFDFRVWVRVCHCWGMDHGAGWGLSLLGLGSGCYCRGELGQPIFPGWAGVVADGM